MLSPAVDRNVIREKIQFDDRVGIKFHMNPWKQTTYHQDILRITKDSVVEQGAKEHQSQGNNLFSFVGGWDDGFETSQESFFVGVAVIFIAFTCHIDARRIFQGP